MRRTAVKRKQSKRRSRRDVPTGPGRGYDMQRQLDELAEAVRQVRQGGERGMCDRFPRADTLFEQLEMSTTELQRSYRESHEALLRAIVGSMMQDAGETRRGWDVEAGDALDGGRFAEADLSRD